MERVGYNVRVRAEPFETTQRQPHRFSYNIADTMCPKVDGDMSLSSRSLCILSRNFTCDDL